MANANVFIGTALSLLFCGRLPVTPLIAATRFEGPNTHFPLTDKYRRHVVSPAPSFVVDEQACGPLDTIFLPLAIARLPRCRCSCLDRSAGHCHIGTVSSVLQGRL